MALAPASGPSSPGLFGLGMLGLNPYALVRRCGEDFPSLLNQTNFVLLNRRFPFRAFRVSELPSDSGCQEQSFATAGLASYFVSATSLTVQLAS